MIQERILHIPLLSFTLLITSVFLSGCSTVSDAASGSSPVFSNLNPFGSVKPATENQPVPATDTSPAEQATPTTIRVDSGASASIKMASATHTRAGDVEATVGDNKQCTTFCALPLRRPAASQ